MSPLALSLRLLQTQPDARLLALAGAGHEPAFEALVRRYRRPLLAYARRIAPSVAADDVLQQALIQAWRALRSGTQVRDARAWLYRIVHNAAISAVRSAEEAPVRLAEGVATLGVEHLVEQRLAAREALAQLAALPELQREVLLGSAVEGRSHHELADELGLTGGSVRGLIYRARAALRTAAAALIPMPAVDWALRNASAPRPGATPIYEAVLGGGSAGLAGGLLKGGTVVSFAGAIAGTAAIVASHPPRHVSSRSESPSARAAHVGSGRTHGRILLASTGSPAEAGLAGAANARVATPAGLVLAADLRTQARGHPPATSTSGKRAVVFTTNRSGSGETSGSGRRDGGRASGSDGERSGRSDGERMPAASQRPTPGTDGHSDSGGGARAASGAQGSDSAASPSNQGSPGTSGHSSPDESDGSQPTAPPGTTSGPGAPPGATSPPGPSAVSPPAGTVPASP